MPSRPVFLSLLLVLLSALALRGQDNGQTRRFFREHGVSLLTPAETNPGWRQKTAPDLPPGNLWAGQSLDQTHSLTFRVAEARGDTDAFAQDYAKLLEAEVGRTGLRLTAATATSLGPWPAWRMEFAGKLGRDEASQVSWLIAANTRVYDLSCLVGGPDAARDPVVAGFAKGFEFIELPKPPPSGETWKSRAGNGLRWGVPAVSLLLCGCLGLLRNRLVSGWALGVGSALLGLAGAWWWALPGALAGCVFLVLKLESQAEQRLELAALLLGAGSLILLVAKAFL